MTGIITDTSITVHSVGEGNFAVEKVLTTFVPGDLYWVAINRHMECVNDFCEFYSHSYLISGNVVLMYVGEQHAVLGKNHLYRSPTRSGTRPEDGKHIFLKFIYEDRGIFVNSLEFQWHYVEEIEDLKS